MKLRTRIFGLFWFSVGLFFPCLLYVDSQRQAAADSSGAELGYVYGFALSMLFIALPGLLFLLWQRVGHYAIMAGNACMLLFFLPMFHEVPVTASVVTALIVGCFVVLWTDPPRGWRRPGGVS